MNVENNEKVKKLREWVIGQSGYGMDGCRLCGSEWMRKPNTEKVNHINTCIASPNYQQLEIPNQSDILKECCDYLENVDAISINTISTGSILHKKMRAAIGLPEQHICKLG